MLFHHFGHLRPSPAPQQTGCLLGMLPPLFPAKVMESGAAHEKGEIHPTSFCQTGRTGGNSLTMAQHLFWRPALGDQLLFFQWTGITAGFAAYGKNLDVLLFFLQYGDTAIGNTAVQQFFPGHRPQQTQQPPDETAVTYQNSITLCTVSYTHLHGKE